MLLSQLRAVNGFGSLGRTFANTGLFDYLPGSCTEASSTQDSSMLGEKKNRLQSAIGEKPFHFCST